MERAQCGYQMSTRWTDPPIVLIAVQLIALPLVAVGCVLSSLYVAWWSGFAIVAGLVALYNFVYMQTEAADTTKYLEFHDEGFKKSWARNKIPVTTFLIAYREEKVSPKGDMLELLEKRYEFLCWRVTWSTVKHLYLQLLPGIASGMYDLGTAKREIADHYDRGNDWFGAFLGPMMVYTSGVYTDLSESLEQAQTNKLELICRKLHMKEGDRYLDIGCGWGTLARHAEKYHGAQATGVTLSTEGAAWCNEQNKKEGTHVNVLEMDYRKIDPSLRFDCVSAIEMAEHVGLANFQDFLAGIKNMLSDDGVFLMQVAGLRQGSNWEDVAWGLFMSRYIFPNADASTPLNWYVKQMELAGFEVQSVETIGRHYSHTLHAWYDNFMANKDGLDKKKYPESLQRLWIFFLAWSTVASGQGTAACYQLVGHKNSNTFNRDQFVGANPHDELTKLKK